MRHHHSPAPDPVSERERDADLAWSVVLAAARGAERLAQANQAAAFAVGDDGQLQLVPMGDPQALLVWRPDSGWQALGGR